MAPQEVLAGAAGIPTTRLHKAVVEGTALGLLCAGNGGGPVSARGVGAALRAALAGVEHCSAGRPPVEQARATPLFAHRDCGSRGMETADASALFAVGTYEVFCTSL